MQTIIYGIALIYTGVQHIGGLISKYTDWATGTFMEIQMIPNLAIIAAAVMLVMWFLYNHTPYGKKMYAIGGNPDAAEVSDILVGVTVFEILKIEMTFLGIDTAWTYIVQGVVIVVAIALKVYC